LLIFIFPHHEGAGNTLRTRFLETVFMQWLAIVPTDQTDCASSFVTDRPACLS
jgi:hypothetical protein